MPALAGHLFCVHKMFRSDVEKTNGWPRMKKFQIVEKLLQHKDGTENSKKKREITHTHTHPPTYIPVAIVSRTVVDTYKLYPGSMPTSSAIRFCSPICFPMLSSCCYRCWCWVRLRHSSLQLLLSCWCTTFFFRFVHSTRNKNAFDDQLAISGLLVYNKQIKTIQSSYLQVIFIRVVHRTEKFVTPTVNEAESEYSETYYSKMKKTQ